MATINENTKSAARAHIVGAFRTIEECGCKMRVFGWESTDKALNRAIEVVFAEMTERGEVETHSDGFGTYYTLNAS